MTEIKYYRAIVNYHEVRKADFEFYAESEESAKEIARQIFIDIIKLPYIIGEIEIQKIREVETCPKS